MTGFSLYQILYGSGFKVDRKSVPEELDAVTDKIEAEYASGVMQDKKLPYLNIETDYSQTDIEQLNTRVTAFIEML